MRCSTPSWQAARIPRWVTSRIPRAEFGAQAHTARRDVGRGAIRAPRSRPPRSHRASSLRRQRPRPPCRAADGPRFSPQPSGRSARPDMAPLSKAPCRSWICGRRTQPKAA